MSRPAAFWDASALVPLCVEEAGTAFARAWLERSAPVVWWGSEVEVGSAVARLGREGALTDAERDGALARLRLLQDGWREILPSDELRGMAGELVEMYALRAGDSLQLAAALTWCRGEAPGRIFVCADRRLGEAARAVGLAVEELAGRKG